MSVVGAAAMAAAFPVAATEHEAARYGPVLTACYEAASGDEARAACLGAMSRDCMDREEGGQTTLGMTSCLNAEAAAWDGYLNEEYKATRGQMRAMDAEEATHFPEFAVRVERLLEAQRAWIAFRDAECALAYADWGSGSMRHIAYADCVMRMTAERTIELRRMRETM